MITSRPAEAAVTAAPVLNDEFDALMARLGPFEQRPTLAIAVSGGADSLALALLATDWTGRRGGRTIGLTVDHGLRLESADEARQTGRWLNARGIDHQTLVWTGPKPDTGIPEQAREARYQRLGDWCRQTGVLHLLTAHHRQDQAETVALRKARQSGPSGLAGMASIRDLSGLRLLRPLLGLNAERLRATLLHRGQDWIDDPSNRNLSFTRNRLRHDGIDTEHLAKEASIRGVERCSADRRLSTVLAETVTIGPAGFARVPAAFFDTAPTDLAEGLLERVLMTIGGKSYPPRKDGLRHLLAALRDPQSFSGKTLGHCRVLHRQGSWLFCRETAAPLPLRLIGGQWLHWQARFMIRYRVLGSEFTVCELGDQGWSARNRLMGHETMRSIPMAAGLSLPSIWRDQELLAIPHLGFFSAPFDPSLLDLRFRPRTPLANAPFAAHMCASSCEETVALLHR